MLYIQGVFNEIAGKRDQSLAELNTYLDNPVGIGEHSDLAVEVKKKLQSIADCEGQLVALQRYFGGPENQPRSEDAPTAEPEVSNNP